VHVTKCLFYFIADSWSISQAQSNNSRVQKCVAIKDSTGSHITEYVVAHNQH